MALDTGPATSIPDKQLLHDLRQAIAAGILVTEPVSQGVPGDDDDLRHRLVTVRQLLESVMGMLAPSAVSGPEHLSVDLAAVVSDCVEIVSLGREVPVTISALSSAVGYGDEVLLRRAVGNVLDNAVRAAGPAGKVMVSLTVRDDCHVLLEVTDSGDGFGGIPPRTGHGLAVVGRAARAWGGSLEIATGPDPGTSVRLVIPCVATSEDLA